MELTANRRPFVYVPLRHHFEQNFHVHHRLQRHGAGRRLDYDEAADPDGLAKVIADEIGRNVDYQPVDTGGAARAAGVDRRAGVGIAMRAREPDASGFVQRDGIDVYWERFGTGDPALLFICVDPIVESRMWKAQVPWFARTHTVLTFDPRGNGRSSRTTDPAAYTDDEFVIDAIDVLDANDIEQAVLVGVCQGAGVASCSPLNGLSAPSAWWRSIPG